MKGLLSESGGPEIGLGALMIFFGYAHISAPGIEPGVFFSGAVAGLGLVCLLYGLHLRAAYRKALEQEKHPLSRIPQSSVSDDKAT